MVSGNECHKEAQRNGCENCVICLKKKNTKEGSPTFDNGVIMIIITNQVKHGIETSSSLPRVQSLGSDEGHCCVAHDSVDGNCLPSV